MIGGGLFKASSYFVVFLLCVTQVVRVGWGYDGGLRFHFLVNESN